MKLHPLNIKDLQIIRQWRNQSLETLRTPYPLTYYDQQKFLQNYNPNKSRYWTIYTNKTLIGLGGLTNIQWENRITEISLIIGPKYRKKGSGSEAVRLLLNEAFNNLGLKTVFGECYKANTNIGFWEYIAEEYKGYTTTLPNRKFWKGRFHDGFYFSIDADAFISPA